jgi:hypothetical protein
VSQGVELPFQIFNRRIRPFSLALLIATIVVVYQYEIMEQGPGPHGFDVVETMFASFAVCLLFFGWLLKNDAVHEWGLVLAAGVWAARMSLYVLDQGWSSIGVWLSLSWFIGAFGAWMLEAYDHRWHVHIQAYINNAGEADE